MLSSMANDKCEMTNMENVFTMSPGYTGRGHAPAACFGFERVSGFAVAFAA